MFATEQLFYYFMGKLFCHALRNPWLNIKRNHIVVFIFFLRMQVIYKALGFREKEKQNQKKKSPLHCSVIPLMSGEIISDVLRP
jgi:RimJ/RimL family protein N-acetyltransferase